MDKKQIGLYIFPPTPTLDEIAIKKLFALEVLRILNDRHPEITFTYKVPLFTHIACIPAIALPIFIVALCAHY
jgi:hypothetical protein